MTTAALNPDPSMRLRNSGGSLLAVLAFVAVGLSVAAEELASYPIAGGQALRYCGAAVLLLLIVRFHLRRPSRRELVWVIGSPWAGATASAESRSCSLWQQRGPTGEDWSDRCRDPAVTHRRQSS